VSVRPGEVVAGPLAPGDYKLLVQGDRVAAMALPFTVAAGAEVTVKVPLAVGVVQRFAIVVGAVPHERAMVRVRRGDAGIAFTVLTLRPDAPAEHAVALAAGDYVVDVLDRERVLVSRPFTVGAAEGAVVRVALP
jgi:hypothetical protein